MISYSYNLIVTHSANIVYNYLRFVLCHNLIVIIDIVCICGQYGLSRTTRSCWIDKKIVGAVHGKSFCGRQQSDQINLLVGMIVKY